MKHSYMAFRNRSSGSEIWASQSSGGAVTAHSHRATYHCVPRRMAPDVI
jgi:hypothetical protein